VEERVDLRHDKLVLGLELDLAMLEHRLLRFRLERVLLRGCARLVLSKGCVLQFLEELDMVRVDLDRARGEVVLVEQGRSHGGHPQTHRFVVAVRCLCLGESGLASQPKLPGEWECLA
jgi:hypothetical protein